MAKTKYTPELVQIISNAIAQDGGDRSGWEAGGISETTFYDWQKNKTEFSEAIAQAKKEYRETCPDVLKRQARRAFADYLFGRVEEVWVSYEDALTKEGDTVVLQKTKRVNRGVPKWAIDRILGPGIDVLEALKTLATAGILPSWLVQVATDEIGDARKGITEAVAGILPEREGGRTAPGLTEETAAAIRAHLLGVQPTDAVGVSVQVDSRPKSDQDLREVTTNRD